MTRKQKRHLVVQGLRHVSRLFVLLAIVLTVYLSLYSHYRAAKAIEDEYQLTGFDGVVLRNLDKVIGPMTDPQGFLDGFNGTIWSWELFGLGITDPLAAAEIIATSKSFYMPLLISIIIPVAFTLILGKIFCSWMCPAGFLFEWTDKLRRVLRLAEIHPGDVRFSHRNKYVLLGIGLAFALIIGMPFFARFYPPAVVSRLAHAWVYGATMTGMLIVLGVIIFVEVAVSPRWWCRTMCPGGALYGLIGSKRLVRIRLEPKACTGCRDCEPVCPMGLYPVRDSIEIECDNCGLCLRHCPEDALVYSIGLPGNRRASMNQRTKEKKPRARRIQPAASTAAAVLLLLAIPAKLDAHHILGLPHYSYKENYPQVPTLEYPATTGPYDVLMTSYPGIPSPGEPANIAFYIKNREADEPYASPISVRVLQTFTFGRNKTVHATTEIEPFDATHKLSVTFPEEGEFIVELTMGVEGQPEVIPFLMVVGEPTATASILTALGGGLGLFIVVVRAIKIKRSRRESRAQNDDEALTGVATA